MTTNKAIEFVLKNEIKYWRFQKAQAILVLLLILLEIGILEYATVAVLKSADIETMIIVALVGIAFHLPDIYATVLYYCNARKNCGIKKREHKNGTPYDR